MNTGRLQEDTRKIVGILSVLFSQAKIYLYGSRARGDLRQASDIDVAIYAGHALQFCEIGEASDVVKGLIIPLKVMLSICTEVYARKNCSTDSCIKAE